MCFTSKILLNSPFERERFIFFLKLVIGANMPPLLHTLCLLKALYEADREKNETYMNKSEI
jgi:hypothetical protein